MSLAPASGIYGTTSTPTASHISLIAPSLQPLVDAPATPPLCDASLQDYLLIECLRALHTSAQVARQRIKKREEEMLQNGLLPPPPQSGTVVVVAAAAAAAAAKSTTNLVQGSKGGEKLPLSEEEEAVRLRLDALGAHAGSNLVERLVGERGRFTDTLDVIKFLCKDIWVAVWDKQIDNLRTNHRGVYVLQDNTFRPILRISSYEGPADALARARIHTAFPAGLVRGALARLGINATVTTDIPALPQCTFQIKLPKGT